MLSADSAGLLAGRLGVQPAYSSDVAKEDFMRLQIVWRNPIPLAKMERTVQRVRNEQFGALYVVTNPDTRQEFELILGAA